MSTPEEHLSMQWDEVHRADADLATLRRLGVLETDPAYTKLWETRGAALAKVGRQLPRATVVMTHEVVLSRLQTLGLVYAGASPGFTIEELKDAVVTVWHDGDAGWVSEARFSPRSPPIYKSLTSEDAVAFIKGEESGPLIARVFTKDEYYGE